MVNNFDYEIPSNVDVVAGSGYFPVEDNEMERVKVPDIIVLPASCKSDTVAVLVKTRPYGFAERIRIRELLHTSGVDKVAAITFVIGQTDLEVFDADDEMKLKEEIQMMGDFVVGDFIDSYHTLKKKELVRYQYFVDHCDAPTAMMIDDDIEAKFPQDLLLSFSSGIDSVQCLLKLMVKNEPIRSMIPEKYSKWIVSEEEYPFEYYPDFCNGPCYAISHGK
eukprot:GHVH01003765.1.p1 GENE.GHVH01003765.1~~GHVH01003765.1.p1  ORF type:complete len:257 (+),score=35.30 GHVH01003765.1:110-772(+)